MAFQPSLGDRLTRLIVRVLASVPTWLMRFLAGPKVTIDGNELFPDVQLILRLLNSLPESDRDSTPLAVQRVQLDKKAYAFSRDEPVRSIKDITIPTRAGSVPARVYSNVRPGKPILGSVVYFHGGGFVLGSLDSTESICRAIASWTDLVVISVDYRLAPEHKFPAGIEDSIDAYAYVRAHEEWGKLVAVAGDSAGGTIAAVVSNETTRAYRSSPATSPVPPDFQLLFFPVTDLTERRQSFKTFGKGYMLTEAAVDWYTAQYLNSTDKLADPRVSPIVADLTGVPPAHIAVGGYDVLRDECVDYAAKLRAAGVDASLQLVTGHIHSFPNAAGVSRTASIATRETVAALKKGMRRAAQRRMEAN